MSFSDSPYDSPQAWYAAAIARETMLAVEEIRRRQLLADAHNAANNIRDPEVLSDQRLYIHGYMELEEYQSYLFSKYSKG
ncbi:hypothetical protein FE236_03900 [Mariprofundus erugo]|uniref:Antitoxin VbhA domain-containing protein n=1 Tax=Mariprofundus erugo TaxID=2528639 RepID=A0A5R9GPK6_9PROT|nr:hypothetical protein [Mariprofundus erugo]TLS67005.1 hypothetical protein FEF65_08625 [Mariprofundus erugo]TLS77293.1 hypothetical protein FE236_03900 [Mariprofundus erugo]